MVKKKGVNADVNDEIAVEKEIGDDLTDEEKAEIDNAAQITEIPSGTWKYELKEPFEYQEQTYTELMFDFGKLCGRDIAAIEHELEQLGLNLFSNAGLSNSYAERAAALACENIGDMYALEELWGADYNIILRRTRTFLSLVKMTETVPRRAWKYELKKPIEINGKTYHELEFDYRKIKGKILLNISNEFENLGHALYAKSAASYNYAVRVAAAACNIPLETTDLERLGAAEFCEIITRAKLFLAGIAV